MRAHFLNKILAPIATKLAFGFEILASKILYKKCARKMLMKLTAEGVDFINILSEVPKVQKDTTDLTVSFQIWDLRDKKLYIKCW
jgi:hypothetical protein